MNAFSKSCSEINAAEGCFSLRMETRIKSLYQFQWTQIRRQPVGARNLQRRDDSNVEMPQKTCQIRSDAQKFRVFMDIHMGERKLLEGIVTSSRNRNDSTSLQYEPSLLHKVVTITAFLPSILASVFRASKQNKTYLPQFATRNNRCL